MTDNKVMQFGFILATSSSTTSVMIRIKVALDFQLSFVDIFQEEEVDQSLEELYTSVDVAVQVDRTKN